MDRATLLDLTFGLFAQRASWDPRLLWATLILVGVILAGALLIVVIDRWRRNANEEECPSANDQLAEFRELYEKGAMTQEEFDRIRATLTGRLREEFDVPVAPPPQPGANGSSSPPTPPSPSLN